MGKRCNLSEVEKAKIDAWKSVKKSNREIAKLLNRSANAVNNYVKEKQFPTIKKKRGRHSKLSERDKRRIVATASQSVKGCRRIAAEVVPHVSKSTVYSVLKASPHLVRERMQKAPMLKLYHKEARLKFAEAHLTWTSEWSKVSNYNFILLFEQSYVFFVLIFFSRLGRMVR